MAGSSQIKHQSFNIFVNGMASMPWQQIKDEIRHHTNSNGAVQVSPNYSMIHVTGLEKTKTVFAILKEGRITGATGRLSIHVWEDSVPTKLIRCNCKELYGFNDTQIAQFHASRSQGVTTANSSNMMGQIAIMAHPTFETSYIPHQETFYNQPQSGASYYSIDLPTYTAYKSVSGSSFSAVYSNGTLPASQAHQPQPYGVAPAVPTLYPQPYGIVSSPAVPTLYPQEQDPRVAFSRHPADGTSPYHQGQQYSAGFVPSGFVRTAATRVYFRSLPFAWTEEKLKYVIQKAIKNKRMAFTVANMPLSEEAKKKNKGWAIVQFDTVQDAQTVRVALNQTKHDNQVIEARFDKDRDATESGKPVVVSSWPSGREVPDN